MIAVIKKYIKKLFSTWNRLYWLHIGDLVTLCEGEMTAEQYLIASRVLDAESIYKGNGVIWQNHLSKLVNPRKSNEQQSDDKKFEKLLRCLDLNDLNPNIAYCSISDYPVVLNNGTHRLSWCILRKPNSYLPCEREFVSHKQWFPHTGKEYWKEKGLTTQELQELENRYRKIVLDEVRTFLTSCISYEFVDDVEKAISVYGRIIGKEMISINKKSIF